MKIVPQITLRFNGRCREAVEFYERSLGAKIAFMLTWAASPMAAQAPQGWGEKIMHGRITLGDTDLIGGDVQPHEYAIPKGFSILLNMDDPDEGERVFNTLAEKGTINMRIQKTFWAARYGMVTDQFGIPWEINCEQPA
jgi:PhnB protein